MHGDFIFNERTLNSILLGRSAIDLKKLNIMSLEEAVGFIRVYGYDWDDAKDKDQLWAFHRQAVTLINETLAKKGNTVPEVLADPNRLGHVGYLLVYASTEPSNENEFQKWSCALLRVMHVLAHLRNDLSSAFVEQIHNQITRPFKNMIVEIPGVQGVTLGRSEDKDQIKLYRFDIKPIKTSTSSVVKLLAKSEYVVPFVMDRIGLRFVTRGVFDSFRVLRFLVEKNLISFPNNIPDQAKNTLYPGNLFFEFMYNLIETKREVESDSLEAMLQEKLKESLMRAEYKEKYNEFSGEDYRAIKFINRRRITVENFSFFYPYEIQIMDQETFHKTLSGPTAHDKYKERQIQAARQRVFGEASE